MSTKTILDHFFVGGNTLYNDFFGNLTWNVDSFPRFNIVQIDEKEYRIELALPGWSKDNIKIHMDAGLLTIEGEKQESTDRYIHRGISGKAFKRSFFVPKNLEITKAALDNGLLKLIFEPRAINPAKYIEIK